MASPGTPLVPRLLLPRYQFFQRKGRISPLANGRQLRIRYASSAAKGKKPIVLEKPAKFNPPSHGRRLPDKTRLAQKHYGGDLSAFEASAQKVKEYPGLMSPKGTWSHWFWNSRNLHLLITVGTLSSLAIFTLVENFKRTTPYIDMVPSKSDFASHPVSSMRTLIEVIRLTEAYRSDQVAEKRAKRVDDVAKRKQYRKAHGIETRTGPAAWFGTKEEEEPEAAAALPPVGEVVDAGAEEPAKRKKFLGIF